MVHVANEVLCIKESDQSQSNWCICKDMAQKGSNSESKVLRERINNWKWMKWNLSMNIFPLPIFMASLALLCPLKRCKSNYYEASISDGKSKVYFVGFSPSQQTRMTHLMEKKQPIHRKISKFVLHTEDEGGNVTEREHKN